MALVNMSAQLIEKCIFLQHHHTANIVRFHARPELVNLLHDGSLALAMDGTVIAADAMTGLPGGKFSFMGVSIVTFVVLGSVLEGIPAIVLFGPLLFPIAKQIGVHEVHYAMIVILAMGMGLFAPPFGVGYYAACAISRINPDEGMKPIVGYMVALLIGTLIVAAVPWISIGFL